MTEALRGQIRRRVPAIGWLRRYDRRQLRPDLLAGCVVAALAVPQALGSAAIAGVPVELGLYAVPLAPSRTRSSAPRVNWWSDRSRPSRSCRDPLLPPSGRPMRRRQCCSRQRPHSGARSC